MEGKGSMQGVVVEFKLDQRREGENGRKDRSREAIGREVQVLEVGEVKEGGRDGANEVTMGEPKVSEVR